MIVTPPTPKVPDGTIPHVHTLNLDINRLVSGLRTLRAHALQYQQQSPLKLPSRQVVTEVIEHLSVALFPNRLGLPHLSEDGVDYFVGHTLDVALRALFDQVKRELVFSHELANSQNDHFSPVQKKTLDYLTASYYAAEQQEKEYESKAAFIIQEFSTQLLKIRRLLESDIRAAYKGDPAARSVDEVLVSYPGIIAITHYRLAHELYRLGAPLLARMIAENAHSATGIDIHPGATIGGSFFIDHGTGVVIGETAIIGERVRIYQAVTLGAKRFLKDDNGELLKGGARHPIIEDDVVIYAGATILGRITIGHGSSIGGNVWLTRSVPPNSHITQAQARHETFEQGSGI